MGRCDGEGRPRRIQVTVSEQTEIGDYNAEGSVRKWTENQRFGLSFTF